MRRSPVAALFLVLLCSCFDEAYEEYCRASPLCDGGVAPPGSGGASGFGGGSASAGGSAGLGGGSTGTGGSSALAGGGTAAHDLSLVDTFNAGECLPGQVLEQSNLTLDGAGLVTFYSDSACTNAISTTASGAFYFRADAFGTATITAGSLHKTVTALAAVRLVGNDTLIDNNQFCTEAGLQLAVQAVHGSAPIPAFAAVQVALTATGGFKWQTSSTAGCLLDDTQPVFVPLAAGASSSPLKVFAYASYCGESAGLRFAQDAGLPPGLVASPDAGALTVYLEGFTAGHACTRPDDCCGGVSASCNGTCQ